MKCPKTRGRGAAGALSGSPEDPRRCHGLHRKGCAGAVSSSAVGPLSAMRPGFSTAVCSHSSLATAKLCVISGRDHAGQDMPHDDPPPRYPGRAAALDETAPGHRHGLAADQPRVPGPPGGRDRHRRVACHHLRAGSRSSRRSAARRTRPAVKPGRHARLLAWCARCALSGQPGRQRRRLAGCHCQKPAQALAVAVRPDRRVSRPGRALIEPGRLATRPRLSASVVTLGLGPPSGEGYDRRWMKPRSVRGFGSCAAGAA